MLLVLTFSFGILLVLECFAHGQIQTLCSSKICIDSCAIWTNMYLSCHVVSVVVVAVVYAADRAKQVF